MKVSNGTYIKHETSERIKTEIKTDNFFLEINSGIDNFTLNKVYVPIVSTFSIGSIYGGSFWTELDEAIVEGRSILKKAQEKFDSEMDEHRRRREHDEN